MVGGLTPRAYPYTKSERRVACSRLVRRPPPLTRKKEGHGPAGEIWALIEVDGELLAVMTMWKLTALHHGTANWELSEQCELVYGDEILEALTWTRHSDTLAKTLLPPWYR